jgi:TnpA family transposase
MTASRLLDDIQKQADVTAYLLELLDDEDVISEVLEESNAPLSWRHEQRLIIWMYRDLLKQRLREGK